MGRDWVRDIENPHVRVDSEGQDFLMLSFRRTCPSIAVEDELARQIKRDRSSLNLLPHDVRANLCEHQRHIVGTEEVDRNSPCT